MTSVLKLLELSVGASVSSAGLDVLLVPEGLVTVGEEGTVAGELVGVALPPGSLITPLLVFHK